MKLSKLLGATAVAAVLSAPAMAQTVIFQGTNPNTVYQPVDPELNDDLTTLQILNQAGGFDYNPSFPPLNVDTLFGNIAYDTFSSRTNASEAYQSGTINLNVVAPGLIGPGTSPAPAGDFVIIQGAGTYFNPLFDGGNGSTVVGNTVASIVNVNGLWGVNPLLSSNIVSGSQIGQVNVNKTDFSVATVSGQIYQQAGTDGLALFFLPPNSADVNGFGPLLSVDNFMVAISNNGIAEVNGTTVNPDPEVKTFVPGGMQAAIVNLNSINIEVQAGVAAPNTLTLLGPDEFGGAGQILTGNNSIAVRNVAAAVALYNGDSSIDPSVKDLKQTAFANINSMSFTTPVSAVSDGVNQYAAGNVIMDGVQLGIAEGPSVIDGVGTYVRLGNVAAAIAGEPDIGGLALNDPDMWLDNLGSGVALISGVKQTAVVQLNTISNPVGSDAKDKDAVGGINLTLGGALEIDSIKDPLALPQNAFFQVNSGSNIQIVATEAFGTDIVNLLVAGVDNGTATITNSSQAFVVSMNSVDVGGTLSGGLIQNSYDVGKSGGPFQNVAIATARGVAKIDGLTQVNSQSYNTVGAGTLNNFYLNQLATDVNLASVNYASVSSLDAAATLKNVVQVGSLNVNTITAGSLLTGNSVITQSARQIDTNVSNLAVVNTLQASGMSASTQGAIQQATINMNTILAK